MTKTPPPAPPATPASSTPTSAPNETHPFPSQTMSGRLSFDPSNGELTCDHCGHVDTSADKDAPLAPTIRELDFQAALDELLPLAEVQEARISKCPNCAAQVEFDPDNHSSECPFCATPVVADTGTHRQIKPKAVVPFALEERAAHTEMDKWLKQLWFAPNGLANYARKGRRMDGVYVPYWTYDADTKSSYTGARGTIYYVTQTYVDDGQTKTRQVQKIRWTPVSGRVKRWFDDVLVLASRSLPQSFTEALQPWDLSALETYRPEFLAGFRAEGYTVDIREGYKDARDKMNRVIQRDVRLDIGGDRQRVTSVSTTVSDVTFKHILLPVWVAAYRYRGKSYRFVVNGQTGRVRGERPWSALKLTIAILSVALIAGGIGYLIAQNQ